MCEICFIAKNNRWETLRNGGIGRCAAREYTSDIFFWIALIVSEKLGTIPSDEENIKCVWGGGRSSWRDNIYEEGEI